MSIAIIGELTPEYEAILSPEALEFISELVEKFSAKREELLKHRKTRQKELEIGKLPDFLPETEHVRNSVWAIEPVPMELLDRRVEITGPVERKMIINAMNSGAKVFMADFEDSNSPTWENVMQGQINLRDAVARTIEYHALNGKIYKLNEETAVLSVRPRGWHLLEKHVLVKDKPISASLFDFGLHFFHNAKRLIEKGSGPYFYLPKLESHLEARLWNEVFVYSQKRLGIPQGTIKATVLIETIFAAFEMDEILYELREHSSGLNCGRWDYIFSFIKNLRHNSMYIFPDRSEVTMTVPFMRSYSLLAIKTCHRRKAHAIGGMSAYIPVKGDLRANEEAFRQVRRDKIREVKDGHDGTWVAHPDLVPVAMETFNYYMPKPNQINLKLDDIEITAKDLLVVPNGNITEQGLRTNIRVGIQYMESWLRGKGAAPINNLMEDAATAEISRAQVWQWLHNSNTTLSDGRRITIELYQQILSEEVEDLKSSLVASLDKNKFDEAIELFNNLSTRDDFVEFLTIPGYEYLAS